MYNSSAPLAIIFATLRSPYMAGAMKRVITSQPYVGVRELLSPHWALPRHGHLASLFLLRFGLHCVLNIEVSGSFSPGHTGNLLPFSHS